MDFEITAQIDQALVPLAVALYVIGIFLKATPKVEDWTIPWILLAAAILSANVTDAKIKQFQTAKGYTDDGIIGATTWNSLLPQVKGGNVNDAVRFLRIRLTARGYSELGTSTTFDSTLENKVKHFQTSAGLTSDGIVGMNAWRKLG